MFFLFYRLDLKKLTLDIVDIMMTILPNDQEVRTDTKRSFLFLCVICVSAVVMDDNAVFMLHYYCYVTGFLVKLSDLCFCHLYGITTVIVLYYSYSTLSCSYGVMPRMF